MRVRGDAMQQERPTGDRLEVLVGLGKPHEQRPPVVDKRHEPCHQSAARQVLRGEAAPAPLILQLVEGVFGISPIAIELSKGEDLVRSRGDQHGILGTVGRHVALNEGEPLLIGILSSAQPLAREGPAQHHPASGAAPPRQHQRAVDAFPAGARLFPRGGAEERLDEGLDRVRETQLGEIGLVTSLSFPQDRLIAKGHVPSQYGRARRLRHGIQPGPDPRHAVQRSRLIAGPHVHSHGQPGMRHHGAVIAMRWSSRFLRVIAHHRAVLLAVQALHRRIQIQDPRCSQ